MKLILVAIAVIIVTIGLVKLVDKFIPTKFKPLLQLALWVTIAFLAYNTFQSVYAPIKFNKEKNKRYAQVIESLNDIRDAQLAHRKVTGKFASNFDNLVKFVDTAQYTLTQRRDSSIIDVEANKRFGLTTMTKDIIVIDTLGFESVKDSLFKDSDRYKTMMNVPLDVDKYDKWLETLSGDKKALMEKGKQFQLQAGFLEQNNTKISVFEALAKKDVILFDQDKDLISQENQVVSVDGVNGDALKVGSMDEINTAGNWPKTYGAND